MASRNRLFTGLSAFTGLTKTNMVNNPNGTAAYRRNGMRRPRRCEHRSDFPAIHGSVKASNMRPEAVMRPMTVSPKNTAPCVMKI